MFLLFLKLSHFIPYPSNFSVSHTLSLKLFGQLALIPKTPNRALLARAIRAAIFSHEVRPESGYKRSLTGIYHWLPRYIYSNKKENKGNHIIH